MAGWDDDDRRGEEEWDHTADPGFEEGLAPVDSDDDEAARLDLDDGERLPWLESVDDEDEVDDSSDTVRLVAFLIGGLVVLAALVGGIWWATHRDTGPELVADGSVIEAPDAPYKEAPEDPGGKTFAGTGDTSYAVSEGQSAAPKLATDAAPSEPAAPIVAAPPSAPAAAPSSAAPSGVGVQVGAYTSQTSAESGWTRLSQQHPDLFAGLKHRVVEGRADIGTVYRLQALAGNRAAANQLCGRFKAAGVACQVKE